MAACAALLVGREDLEFWPLTFISSDEAKAKGVTHSLCHAAAGGKTLTFTQVRNSRVLLNCGSVEFLEAASGRGRKTAFSNH